MERKLTQKGSKHGNLSRQKKGVKGVFVEFSDLKSVQLSKKIEKVIVLLRYLGYLNQFASIYHL